MNARTLIQKHEGCTLVAKADAKGKWEIGWGHDGAVEGQTCSQQEADDWIDEDQETATQGAIACAGKETWSVLNEPRQAALIDMAYELGTRGLSEFTNTLALLRQSDYEATASEMLRSDWAREVPLRAQEDAEIMRTGEWPA